MPSDLEQRLSESLRDRAAAGSPIDPVPIVNAAIGQGRRMRSRRRLGVTVLTIVAVTGASLTGLAVRRPSAGHPAPRVHVLTPSDADVMADLARLPAAAGVPGAVTRPDLVATDPRILHFDVSALAAHAWRASWQSTGTYESATVQREGDQVYVAVARDRAALPPPDSLVNEPILSLSTPSAVTIGGVAGTVRIGTVKPLMTPAGPVIGAGLTLFVLLWQPVAGLWATVGVNTTSLDRALQAAGQVRFDRTTRCATPFRVGSPPDGATLRSCGVSLAANAGVAGSGGTHIFADAQLTYGDGSRRLQLLVMSDWENAGDFPRHLKAGPYRAEADPDRMTYTMLVKPIYFTAAMGSPNSYPRQQVLDVLGSIRLAANLEKPQTYYY